MLEALLSDHWVQAGGFAGILLALGRWWQIKYGSGDKRIDADLAAKKLAAERDQQEHNQNMDLNKFLVSQLEKKEERVEKLRIDMQSLGDKYTQLYAEHAKDGARLENLERRAVACEKDRDMLRARLRIVEQQTLGRALPDDPAVYQDGHATNSIDNAAEMIGLPPEEEEE